jgi:Protein of unknown function (DUF3106)
MIFSRQASWWLACCAAGQLTGIALCAENIAPSSPEKLISVPSSLMPPLPPAASPVDFFRQLLAMSARDRKNFLTNRPVAYRERLLAKVHEYEVLGPDERELRLRATELRWCLLPFFHEPATNHAAQFSLIPEDLRDLVKTRVDKWDALSPQLQQEFLANEPALHYFTHVDSSNNPPPMPPLPPGAVGQNSPSSDDQSRWNALSADERQQITAQFSQFFEFTPAEKQKTLNTLSAAERKQMEKTLQSFDQLPAAQRLQCIRAYSRFAGMTPQERAEFLKNAEHWSQMSPKDRQVWRDLVTNVPLWPPLPSSSLMPPLPRPVTPRIHPAVATNLN